MGVVEADAAVDFGVGQNHAVEEEAVEALEVVAEADRGQAVVVEDAVVDHDAVRGHEVAVEAVEVAAVDHDVGHVHAGVVEAVAAAVVDYKAGRGHEDAVEAEAEAVVAVVQADEAVEAVEALLADHVVVVVLVVDDDVDLRAAPAVAYSAAREDVFVLSKILKPIKLR